MDRFIGFSGLIMRASDTDLKSNMDRFIGYAQDVVFAR